VLIDVWKEEKIAVEAMTMKKHFQKGKIIITNKSKEIIVNIFIKFNQN